MDQIALWVGYATMLLGAVACLAGLTYLVTDLTWKALQTSAFGLRVIRDGLAAERKRRETKNPRLPA